MKGRGESVEMTLFSPRLKAAVLYYKASTELCKILCTYTQTNMREYIFVHHPVGRHRPSFPPCTSCPTYKSIFHSHKIVHSFPRVCHPGSLTVAMKNG
ncbi:hypothetical protein POVWA2_014170 [Plasmodium ovale wallikeri]|uniref:Uncharacterized protein n=1 Tax=Plasmodium ovale wallikeri TaxID=864142 RepID=A0A1A8YPI5_PLAOA|nr:hypothetical protein POVWA1_014330 [Plasmodium ovale wallikeri]SBT33322.1 hypothetical protein POVWA2_014170 [Plasmodium ovale wallikeri]